MHTLRTLNHHAYVITGGLKEKEDLCSLLAETHGFILQGNPDVYDRDYNVFSIEDARNLIDSHEMMPVTHAGKKLFIILANSIGHEAQNAILKLIEEPSSYSHFFFIVPSLHILLPTVRSRVYIIETDVTESVADEAVAFLKMSISERMQTVKELADDISKDRKTNQDAIDFVNGIERAIYKKFGAKGGRDALLVIDECKSFMHDRAPSMKMLLESVALAVPHS